jgi:flagellar hook protein FlgE
MSIEQSLDTGVSGMIANQLALDTISNNLANLGTDGFKGSDVSFESALTQTNFSGSAPGNGLGGLNPQQVGLGVQTGAIPVDMSQGALQSTGNSLDVAIQGNGFFEVTQGAGTNTGTSPDYTRVGSFTLDANNNLVQQGTGLEVVGEQTNVEGTAIGGPVGINTTNNQSVGAEGTKNVTFQGNLSSADGALQGSTLTSAFPLQAVDANNNATVATATTPLSQLSIFNATGGLSHFTPPAPPAAQDRTIYVFGTQPNGTAYSGQVTIDPWTSTVQDLMNGINNVLTQGNTQFGNVTMSNGTLTASGVGTGQGFSMFLGESNPDPSTVPFTSSTSPVTGLGGTITGTTFPTTAYTVNAADAGALDPTFTIPAGTTLTSPLTITALVNGTATTSVTVPIGTYAAATPFSLPTSPNATIGDQVQYQLSSAVAGITVATPTAALSDAAGASYDGLGDVQVLGSHTIQPGEAGLLEPTFTIPAGTYGSSGNNLSINVMVNGTEVGSIVPNGTYSAATALSLTSFPHVSAGDVVTYQVTGDKAVTPITWTTKEAADSSSANLTADLNGDGVPDMFQEGSTTDVNAWQYQQSTNATFNWYNARFAPSFVSTSIQVYDPNGGTHTLDATMFRTGTESTTTNGVVSQNNVWDMILQTNPADGTIQNNVIAGLQFDNQGNYLGSANLGSTAHGTLLSNNNNYVGTPGSNAVTINWANAGTQTMDMNLGQPNSNNGLTGYGSVDSAQAISQDGSPTGTLQSLSVNSNGNLVGLYSNGKSLPLYQLQVATFSNPGGLTNIGGNLFQASTNSGAPILRQPGTGGAGSLVDDSLEGSNVDIATQFTEMITAQRGYQVNARVIQTEDGLLQELTTLNTPAQ